MSTSSPIIPYSVLDLAPVCEGSTPSQAFANVLDLARHAEGLGYTRYWLAEHHNMPGIASAATAVLIGYVAGGTSTIRVGSGGVMLPNHAPLQVAEQFGTLASLYPGRIDLGLGRAPGTDQPTARALRRYFDSADQFPADVTELLRYFAPAEPGQLVQAVPGAGLDVPVWLLGSSLFSATLAAQLGLPFAFASHFAPDAMDQALAVYHRDFRPSRHLQQPYAALGLNVIAADTDEEARRLFTTAQQAFVNLRRGRPGKIPPPIDDIEAYWQPHEKAGVERALACSVVGAPATVRKGLEAFIDRHRPDELIIVANIYDHGARKHSYRLAAEALAPAKAA
ncbi:luciferase family oxidoreductase group 1 [Pseudoxanthomonas sp. SORGH_AS 997]|jgi:luciferase family oxidoreductase group 1|uniref:Luciferase-like monooxygenase n=1 Tax=Pseudoxanthomonas winnipegensis TaxID=2480810 RepID=A0AAW8G7C8_9GAMM|nr:luciferase family oxidoreductase group 1 [Pseudoxanthomonas winnipegensis]MDQ1131559.1 luciferase family oxidoreductase group 1 [Pseudoxanthomonas winnipegensis]MDR6138426.1 luciferase family oxidoreductase group 1 [Pseudoxanthomonas sp. SORGH_AS_0997]